MNHVEPLEYDAFLRVFNAEEPDIEPQRARVEDLIGLGAHQTAAPSASQTSQQPHVLALHEMDAATQIVITRLTSELGLYVTEADQDPKKGLILTIDGNWTVCLGNENELDSKLAILSALHQSGEHYSYIDLRRPASPMYR
jgi:chlorophyllide a reductase subunit X